jgi:hypothetical protein
LTAISAAAQTFELSPSTIPGVTLTSAAGSPDLVAKLVPDANARAAYAPTLPYSVVVSNTGSRKIVVFTVRFDYTRPDGKPIGTIARQDYRTTGYVEGQPGFLPGQSCVLTVIGELRPSAPAEPHASAAYYSPDLHRFYEIVRSPAIRASLDSVIYDNGQITGSDISDSLRFFQVENQPLLRLLADLKAMDSQPDEAILAYLDQAGNVQPPSRPVEVAFSESRAAARAMELKQILTRRGRPRFRVLVESLAQGYARNQIAVWRMSGDREDSHER